MDGKFIVKDHEGNPATFENREDAVQAAFIFMTPEQRQSFLETIQPNLGNRPAPAAEPAQPGSPTPESVTPAGDQSNQPVQELPPDRSREALQPEDQVIEAAPRQQTPEDRSQANPASQAAQYEEAASQGLVPPIRVEDDKFIVTDHEGKEAFFTNREEAVQAALDLRTPEQIQKMREVVKLKQKAKVKKTSLAKKQPVAVMANGDDWHGTEGDGELVDADGSVSTDEESSSASETIKNSQASESGSPPPTPEVPTLRQGSLDQDSRSTGKAMVMSEAARQGLVPSIREEEGKFIVTDHEGNPATFENREEAVQAAFIFMTPEQRQQVQEVVDSRGKQNNGPQSDLPVAPESSAAAIDANIGLPPLSPETHQNKIGSESIPLPKGSLLGPKRKVVEVFGGESSQIPGAQNVDVRAKSGIMDSVENLSKHFESNSQDVIVASNPYGLKSEQWLKEASNILRIGGRIVISGTKNNKYTKIPSPEYLNSIGLKIVAKKIPLPKDFEGHIFKTTDGKYLPPEFITTTILEKITD